MEDYNDHVVRYTAHIAVRMSFTPLPSHLAEVLPWDVLRDTVDMVTHVMHEHDTPMNRAALAEVQRMEDQTYLSVQRAERNVLKAEHEAQSAIKRAMA